MVGIVQGFGVLVAIGIAVFLSVAASAGFTEAVHMLSLVHLPTFPVFG